MKFLEEKTLQVLDDLSIPHKGFILASGIGQAKLSMKVPFQDVMEGIRSDPRYGPKLAPHPWGAYLSFRNLNCPEHRALSDICLDFRSREGSLVSVRASLVFARVIPASGVPINCLSLKELETVSRQTRYEDEEEAVYEVLA